MIRAAIYARVSTKKDEQNPETQLRQLRNYAKQHYYITTKEYVDRATGRNVKRAQYQALLKDALYHRFEKILVWKMDRLSRGRIREVLNTLEKLKGYGIEVESITEPFLNTNNSYWELSVAFLAWGANMESERISERVSAGIDRYRADHNGKFWREKEWDRKLAAKLRKAGYGWRFIEKEMRKRGYNITYAGIRKALLKEGFQKGVNLPTKKPTEESKE